ncbi:hypothetical protein, partial [Paraburkholderia sp. Ac-20336]|uniref:hypothetical protein n=1 Tax=Paraburkholderia sp. Ac-20336 TaxID=2703886 RepID=UPI00198086B6
STGKPSSLLCETLDTFASTRSEDQVRTPHQAPTLIGCWFLKISPLTQPCPTPPGTASFASLRLQQRNEIMETFRHAVNRF